MIPKYDEIYRDFLQVLSDEKEHKLKEIRDQIADSWGLTEEERIVRTQGGKQYVFDSRVGWARTYLKKAGFIESPGRAVFIISPRGLDALRENPNGFDNNYLAQFPEFIEFFKPEPDTHKLLNLPIMANDEGESPEEKMDKAYALILVGLVEEVLTEVTKMTPDTFEHLVVNLLLSMGYGGSLSENGLVTQSSGDEGIDGIIKQDKLGFDQIYIQAKKWGKDVSVSRPEIQKFAGALLGQGASKGLFITTAKFSGQAIEYATKHLSTKIVLIDGEKLARLMIENNLGVSVTNTYVIRRIDSDFFNEP